MVAWPVGHSTGRPVSTPAEKPQPEPPPERGALDANGQRRGAGVLSRTGQDAAGAGTDPPAGRRERLGWRRRFGRPRVRWRRAHSVAGGGASGFGGGGGGGGDRLGRRRVAVAFGGGGLGGAAGASIGTS